MTTANLIQVDRAVHEVRCGRPVQIDEIGFYHPEYINAELFKELQKQDAKLIITKNRAHGIFRKNFPADQKIALKNLNFDEMNTIVSGKKPKEVALEENTCPLANAALELARIAQLLPCAIVYKTSENSFKVSVEDVQTYRSIVSDNLEIVATGPLKLCDASKASMKAFRSHNGATEHMAIIIGELSENPLVRIHSSCYTGDLIGSLSCDCGDQLRGAIKLINNDYINNNGGGVILYLMQEGRGIGLVNKLHAYQLQSEGLDTVEANEFLGFDDEERSFEAAATMLKKLGISKVRIITNNPKKIAGLDKLGIEVSERVPMVIRHEHNHAYLEIKSSKSGHLIN